jgi:GNAT superfamily N-acetyltransferase
MDLQRVRLSDPTMAPLLAGLEAEYEARYGPSDEMAAAGEAEFDPPSGLFLAMVDDGIVIAGGGYRRHAPGRCEVKRMWTARAHRRQGHASILLGALEDAARTAGYTTLWLETGPAQPEAAAMYASHGYRRIPVYGRYRDALAFEKTLSGG